MELRSNRIRVLENKIVSSVNLSALEAEAGSYDSALAKAKDAQEALDSLKVLYSQENRSPSSLSINRGSEKSALSAAARPRVTSTMNMFELILMVRSNLACRFKETGHLQESLDIYTELCRLATSSGVLQASGFSPPAGVGQQETRELLFKFGINIGNVLFEMKDYHRALKYYRLTLDRLSSSPSKVFIIKLMANISITLNAILEENTKSKTSGQAESGRSYPTPSNRTGLMKTDYITALNLLLSDNLIPEKTGNGNDVHNANHHKFALNLMVAHYERKDLRAMMNTFRALVSTNIHKHYRRCKVRGSYNGQTKETDRLAMVQSSVDAEAKSSQVDGQLSVVKPEVDQLEKVIGEREESIRRAIVSAYNLIHRLQSESRSEQVDMLHSLIDDNGNYIKDISGYCHKLIQSSACYKELSIDLKMNKIIENLERRKRLDKSIGELKELLDSVVQENFTARSAKRRPIDSGLILINKKNEEVPDTPQGLSYSSTVKVNMMTLQTIIKSSTNLSSRITLQADTTNVNDLVNIACCRIRVNDLERAEEDLRSALSLDPNHWAARYNMMLVYRKRNSSLDPSVLGRGLLSSDNDMRRQVALIYGGFILEAVQSLSTIHETGLQATHGQKVNLLVKELLNCRKKLSPEVCLLIHKALTSPTDATDAATEHPSHSVLQLASRIHPYYVPLAERIIAIHISSFNYVLAENLIKICIKLRPDQVKWHRMLAECYVRSSNYNKAIEAYKTAISLFPFDVGCLKALAKLSQDLGMTDEYDECEKKLQSALTMFMSRVGTKVH